MAFFWALVDPVSGQMTDKKQPWELQHLSNPRDQGWQAINIPPGVEWVDILGYSTADGLELAPHRRDWDLFWDEIGDDPLYQQVVQGAMSSPPLTTLLTAFAVSMVGLTNGATPAKFQRLQTLWPSLKAQILASTFPSATPQQVVDRMLQIAAGRNIELETAP